MQPTTQLYIVLIGLVFFIAPFSRAGSNRQKLRLPSKPLFPFKGDETGFYAFDKTYGSISNLTSDKAKRETQEKNEYRAVLSHDKVWRIKVTGPDYDQTKLQRFEAYWSGEINVSGRLLGSGGQGKVTEGTFLLYDDTFQGTVSERRESSPCDDAKEAAIKESMGSGGYESAQTIVTIDSPHIVTVFGNALKTVRNPIEPDAVDSIVAFEKLGMDAQHLLWQGESIDINLVMQAAFGAAEDAAKKSIINLDQKLENLMVDQAGETWKSIDWDMAIEADPNALGWEAGGTVGYMCPEMLLDFMRRSNGVHEDTGFRFNIDRAQVWTLGMIVLYLLAGQFHNEVTEVMEYYAKGILDWLPEDTDPIWYWIYLVVQINKNEDPTANLFPEQIRDNEDIRPLMAFFEKTLCKEEDRLSLQQTLTFIRDEIPG